MNDKIAKVKAYAKENMSKDRSGHGFDHIQRVANMVLQLMGTESANGEIALTAAYLHDVFDDKIVSDPNAKRDEVKAKLTEFGFDQDEINQVMDIINHMSFSDNIEHKQSLSKEGQIVQDADRLDAIGAIGIARAFQYGGAHRRTIYDPNIKPRDLTTKAAYRNAVDDTTINHFYEKLFKIASDLNTDAAKQIGKKRTQYMRDFVTEFKQEWDQ
ncbi:HD domain-containing protein [Fructilactobacillus fructivorans]|uniref:HD domain-containing protein n=1 Tax=Fructilactobacillus fructivorans TaxID=1614 RepID=UPI0002196D51|nr:HD domain-containing protein [Fructilactobacillus fructivorans]KRK57484.1 metal-dependent phosphohydrolase [Fructilactobacillus fructivorans]KRN12366.1 metal-dependent phosphohydrolase [Fructilactobacillus fructivorans]